MSARLNWDPVWGAIHDLALLNPIAGTPPARAALAQVNDTLRSVFAHKAL